jgi:hypothetical protein
MKQAANTAWLPFHLIVLFVRPEIYGRINSTVAAEAEIS